MRLRIGSLRALGERSARKFTYPVAGGSESGILARHAGRVVAYRNRCRHRPFPLDWDDGVFYDRDGRFLVCRTHGAAYEPDTGLCVFGPCAGDALEPLPLAFEGDDVLLVLAEEGPEGGAG